MRAAGDALRPLSRLRALRELRHPARVLLQQQPHEPDFWLLRHLADPQPLLIDVGAHAGHSSASMRVVCPRARIHAFEPHPDLGPALALLAPLLGDFRSTAAALAERSGSGTLHVPLAGRSPLYGEGTLEAGALDEAFTRARIAGLAAGRPLRVATVRCRTLRLDELDLAPAAIKVDAQGGEWAALKGMEVTLDRHRPLVVVENNPHSAAIAAWLERFGYRPFVYDERADRLRDPPNPFEALNAVFVAPPQLDTLPVDA